jgi:competence ComEA-like helix-hairpin-helix protein
LSGANLDSEKNANTNEKQTTKININTATQAELETLPGIGPSTSLKIINHRNENGKFKSIEDIKEVSGIGESKFNNINSLTLNGNITKLNNQEVRFEVENFNSGNMLEIRIATPVSLFPLSTKNINKDKHKQMQIKELNIRRTNI